MLRKQPAVVLILVSIVAGLILCVALGALCGIAACGQAALPTLLLLLTYLLVYKLTPQIPVIASAMTGPPRKPPRFT